MATSTPVPSAPPRRRSFAGAIVLIILGLVFLLGNIGVLTWSRILYWFAHYWPVLLIIWGVVKLLEYYQAQRAGYASPGIGAGGVFLLIFLVMFGMAASVAGRHDWSGAPGIVIDGEELSFFGKPYDFQEEVEQAFTPGSRVEITSVRGDVNVVPWDEARIKIVADKRVRAENDADAQKLHERSKPQISTVGSVVTVNIGSVTGTAEPFRWSPTLRTNVQIFVPRKTPVKIITRHGDVSVDSREGEVEIDDSHGSVMVRDIKGNANIQVRHGDVRAEQVTGNLNIEGRADDVTVADVNGTVALLGEFFGQTRVSRVGKAIRFSSSKTEMETGRIDGELNMDSGDLRASQLAGLKIRTRSKDIHLENISGDVEVANRNASVELHADKPPLGSISINNDRGGIQVYLPSGAAFQLQAKTRGGDIESDFEELKVQESGRDSTISGSVGSAGAKAGKVQLSTEHGDIEIRKRS